jgi:hypothetical protein
VHVGKEGVEERIENGRLIPSISGGGGSMRHNKEACLYQKRLQDKFKNEKRNPGTMIQTFLERIPIDTWVITHSKIIDRNGPAVLFFYLTPVTNS